MPNVLKKPCRTTAFGPGAFAAAMALGGSLLTAAPAQAVSPAPPAPAATHVKPAKPQPVQPAKPAPSEASDQSEAAEPAESSDAAESSEESQPEQSANPTDPTAPTQAAKPKPPAQPVGVVVGAHRLKERQYPSTDSSVKGLLSPKNKIPLKCKVHALNIGGNDVWFLRSDKPAWIPGKHVDNDRPVKLCKDVEGNPLDNDPKMKNAVG
ncbi:hypothetical protein ACH429_13070 [Streptomyces pathocidini]|uniref:SH3 domain-containing protein n=1 Tax=Streptomyces pathocidini TaxID=1650571 RepID=A0ABW7UT38_9ACTN|nr:hypothetical protein [Streptomyces pathocidini]